MYSASHTDCSGFFTVSGHISETAVFRCAPERTEHGWLCSLRGGAGVCRWRFNRFCKGLYDLVISVGGAVKRICGYVKRGFSGGSVVRPVIRKINVSLCVFRC